MTIQDMREGALAQKLLPDGREVVLYPLIYGCQVVVGSPDSEVFDNCWHYDHAEVAAKAMLEWDGFGEPQGWHRNPMTGRRRPGGDAAQEYIRW